jgi:hypothetical protein
MTLLRRHRVSISRKGDQASGCVFLQPRASIGSPLRVERQLNANLVAINNRREIIADGCHTAGVKALLCYAFLAVELHPPRPD